MESSADKQTTPVSQPEKRGRGRPVTGQAMTNAERQRRYRQNLKSAKRNVTKNRDVEEGACEAIDLQGSEDFLLASLAQLEQQVNALFERERQAMSEVARLQALIVPPMSGQMHQGELKDFEIEDLRNRCLRYEKLLNKAYQQIGKLEQRLTECNAGV